MICLLSIMMSSTFCMKLNIFGRLKASKCWQAFSGTLALFTPIVSNSPNVVTGGHCQTKEIRLELDE